MPTPGGSVAERAAATRAVGRLVEQVAPGQAYAVERTCASCGSIEHGALRVSGPAVWASVSRADGWLLVAVCDTGPVGVDAEPSGSVSADVLAAVALHPSESATDGVQATRTWVRKEAVLKAYGLGLSVDPRQLRLSHPDDPPAVIETAGVATTQLGSQADRDVRVMDLGLPQGLCGAVAVIADRPVELTLRTAAAADG